MHSRSLCICLYSSSGRRAKYLSPCTFVEMVFLVIYKHCSTSPPTLKRPEVVSYSFEMCYQNINLISALISPTILLYRLRLHQFQRSLFPEPFLHLPIYQHHHLLSTSSATRPSSSLGAKGSEARNDQRRVGESRALQCY